MSDYVARESDVAGGMRSGLAWALLGLVIEQPSYGHELVQRFEHVYGEMLVLRNRTHIYRLLETLRVRSLIEETDAPAETRITRQVKPHYQVTERGRSAYQEWLVTQAEEERRRARTFVRQLAMLQPEDALAVIDRYAQECLEEVGQAKVEAPDGARDVADRLADENQHLTFEVRVSWIEYARRELQALIEQRDAEASGR